jgi:hypothetical protein
MTYNSLVNQVQNELERNDALFFSYIPNFINNAIDRINADLPNLGFELYVTGFFTVGNPVISKPGRWRRTISINYGTGTEFNTQNQMYLRTYDYLILYSPDATVLAPPLYYADYGFYNIIVAPTPDIAYPFKMAYLEIPPYLTSSNQTNWITNYAPRLLLYGTLLEAVIYLKDSERIQEFEGEYQKSLQPLLAQDKMRYTDRTSNRGSD